jgi:hypothetical protein
MFETGRFASDKQLQSMASLLTEMCALNDQVRLQTGGSLTKFHAVSAAPISIQDYLTRIRRYTSCSDCCFVVSLIYLDRAQSHAGIIVDSLNIHRLIITSIMLAAKYFEDRVQRNSVFAQIGGICPNEMNGLEVEFLNAIGFNLEISPKDFALYESALEARFCKETNTSSFSTASTVSPAIASIYASSDIISESISESSSPIGSPLSVSSMECDALLTPV